MTPRIASSVARRLGNLDPETAHVLALRALRLGLAGRERGGDDPALAVETLGLRFPNPIGLAAGFDKNAAAVTGLMALGFGYVEAGTVTLRPQPGNPRPRLFRLAGDAAVINRLGFNNAGLGVFLRNLRRAGRRDRPLGANVGINKDSADIEGDYARMVAAVAPHADYVTINVSSPNTPGLRDLQAGGRLAGILAAIAAAVPQRPPLLVKLAPDLPDAALRDIVETSVAGGVQGLIVANTTISRPAGLRSPLAREAGGLSGAPLFALATTTLARTALMAGGRLALIGVGGVATGVQALRKLQAGASLVQLYTGFAYGGPALVPRLKRELLAALRAEGYARAVDAVGTDLERLAGGT